MCHEFLTDKLITITVVELMTLQELRKAIPFDKFGKEIILDPDNSPTSCMAFYFYFLPSSAVTHFFLFLAPVIPNLNSVYLFQCQSHLWVLSPLRMHDSVWCLWQINVHLCCLRLLVSWCARWALGSAGAVWLLVVCIPGLAVGTAGWMTGCCSSCDESGSWWRIRMEMQQSETSRSRF